MNASRGLNVKTLEKMFRDAAANNVIDFTVRAHACEGHQVTFYIHPTSVNGDTLDYVVEGDHLTRLHCDNVGDVLKQGRTWGQMILDKVMSLNPDDRDDYFRKMGEIIAIADAARLDVKPPQMEFNFGRHS